MNLHHFLQPGHLGTIPVPSALVEPARASQYGGGDVAPRHLHAEPQRVLYPHETRADVLVERTRDGHDYMVFCVRHQWASPAVPAIDLVGMCPFCLCEIDESRGRQRYERLQQVTLRAFGNR